MRSSNISNPFEAIASAALACVALSMTACSTSSSSTSGPACRVAVSGSVSESGDSATACASVTASQTTPGDFSLSLTAKTETIAQIYILIDLGAAPASGSYSSETTTDWAALAANDSSIDSGVAAAGYADGGPTACAYFAGANAVPSGSFALDLTFVDTKSGAAHGSVSAQLRVHAPPGADCGPSDIENVTMTF